MSWFVMRSLWGKTALVLGDVVWVENHSIIVERSYLDGEEG